MDNRVFERVLQLRSVLMELRARLHAQGRRPEECYEMSTIDEALRYEQSKQMSTTRKPSKLSLALAYLEAHPGATVYEAGKAVNASLSGLYRAIKARKAKAEGICPKCGQKIAASG